MGTGTGTGPVKETETETEAGNRDSNSDNDWTLTNACIYFCYLLGQLLQFRTEEDPGAGGRR